jgi:glutamate 5-kinase
MLIVVKIGTNVLSLANGLLDLSTLGHLCDQIAQIKAQGHQVIIVTSGAVGAGRKVFPNLTDKNKIEQRQVLAAVGQIRLMNTYLQLFEQYDIHVAQILATKEDFRDRRHYLNMRNCFHSLLRDNIVPIVNENDVISVTELMFTDNDELAGLISAMINATKLVILSNIDGVFTGAPDAEGSFLIEEIAANDKKINIVAAPIKSSFGRGGMSTKLRIAQKTAQVGIETYIANGKKRDILIQLMNEEKVGTRFVAAKNVSNLKKWLAYNALENKGSIQVNQGAATALQTQVSSLLPIGILAVQGNFQKGDIVAIIDEKNENIGIGMVLYGAALLLKNIGLANKKPIIHYDYLYLTN